MGILANLFGYVLKICFSIIGNYGWAVVIFSVIIKAIIFPLTLKQQKSLKKNQELQPKLAALQEKYKDNQEQLAIEYQKFMKENKFNPFGGCLLMILQLFVLFGVLYVVANPMTYMEKYKEDELNVALKEAIIIQDYSGDSGEFYKFATTFIKENSGDKNVKQIIKDSKTDEEAYIKYYKRFNRYHELKVLKQKYQDHLMFLSIDLADITAQNPSNLKLWIFPILTVISYYLSLWMVSRKQKQMTQKMKDADGNEIEMPNMATMNIMMPLMSGWISYSVPQGMGLYWFINSLIQIVIQLITDKVVSKEKTPNINKNGEIVLEPVEPIKEESELNEKTENIGSTSTKHKNKNNNKNKNKNKKRK